MRITVHLLGQLRHLAARDSVSIEVGEGATVSDVVMQVAAGYDEAFRAIVLDAQGALRPSLMVLHNDIPIDKASAPRLREGDQVTLLTAIAGG